MESEPIEDLKSALIKCSNLREQIKAVDADLNNLIKELMLKIKISRTSKKA